MQRLLAFYSGSGPDHRGRLLQDIVQQDDRWLETTHDYVQWLFPLAEASSVLPAAPLLTPEVVAAFATDGELRRQLRACFLRMLAFYGLAEHGDRIEKGPNWAQRKTNWFTQPTHNNLRITRILKCLCALGLREEARRFLACLEGLARSERDCGVGAMAIDYWRRAVDE